MMRMHTFGRRTRAKLVACFGAVLMVLSGCSSFTGIYDIPLPGGADIGDNPMELKIQFRNVLDLVPQTHVKLNEVAVGRVTDVNLAKNNWNAEVTVLVNRSVHLPENALANIKMSSLLGEKYISLEPPPQGTGVGQLHDGETIPVSRTNRNVEVEEVLGALSLLLNGGGVDQINTIAKELEDVYKGAGGSRELRALLNNSNTLVKSLDGQTNNIDKALDATNRMTTTLNRQKGKIVGALQDLPQGMKVLDRQREDIVKTLKALGGLGKVATEVMDKSKKDLVTNLKSLQPILKNITRSGMNLGKSLQILFTFPLPLDQSAAAVHGDYMNLNMDLNLNIKDLLDTLSGSPDVPLIGGSGLPTLPNSGTGTSPVDGIVGGLLGGGA